MFETKRDFAAEIAKLEADFDQRLMGKDLIPTENMAATFAVICDTQRQYIAELKAENLRLQTARYLLSAAWGLFVAVESGAFKREEISRFIDTLQKWNRADSE